MIDSFLSKVQKVIILFVFHVKQNTLLLTILLNTFPQKFIDICLSLRKTFIQLILYNCHSIGGGGGVLHKSIKLYNFIEFYRFIAKYSFILISEKKVVD